MAATLSVSAAPSGGQKALTSVTVTVAGHANSTAHIAQISNPQGHVQTVNFTTNGSGGASFAFVPQMAGTHTITTYPAATVQVATTSLNVGGR